MKPSSFISTKVSLLRDNLIANHPQIYVYKSQGTYKTTTKINLKNKIKSKWIQNRMAFCYSVLFWFDDSCVKHTK
jgi:hypothetical protein